MNLHFKEENTNTGKNKKMENNLKIEGYKLLSQKVYQVLKTEILKGALKPGTKLLEGKIAEQMGVSRTPIREALRELAAEGFVKMREIKTSQIIDKVKELFLKANYYIDLDLLKLLQKAGPNPCPPTIIGVGIGGTADRAMVITKKAITHKIGEPNKSENMRQWRKRY